MKIVRASKNSLGDIVPLFNAYRMFYEQPHDEEGVKEFLQERLQKEESVIFIAFDGEKAAGFVQLYPTFTSIGMQKAYILNDLFVDGALRRKGVGKALIQKAFQFCEKEKVRFLILETAPDNHSAKALYEGAGMEKYNEYHRYIKYF